MFGKYICYALLALSIDLIWGYCGILSLGHGAFFALGGYAMGMYLMRQIGARGVYAHPILPDFMVFLNWTELPFYWYGFQSFPYAHADGAAGARRARLRVRLVRVPQPRHRRLSLDHHAGADLRADARRSSATISASAATTASPTSRTSSASTCRRRGRARRCSRFPTFALLIGFVICRVIVTSKLGKVLVAIRDAETRTRFLGYRVESYKLFVFTLSACMAGVAGALYVPQVGIINPSEFSPANSIEAVIWVAVGGRGTLTGAVLGAVVVNYAKTYFTSGFLAPYWLFVLGGLFVAVTLFLPRGIVGTIEHYWARMARAQPRQARAPTDGNAVRRRIRATARRVGARDERQDRHIAALSQRRHASRSTASRRSTTFRSPSSRRDARDHRAERRRQDHDDGRHHRQDPAG